MSLNVPLLVVLIGFILLVIFLLIFNNIDNQKNAERKEKARLNRVAAKERADLEEKKHNDYLSSLFSSVKEHSSTLIRKKSILLRTGDYGEVIDAGWMKELDNFLSIVDPYSKWQKFYDDRSFVVGLLDDVVAIEEAEVSSKAGTNVDELSGEEFEAHCASLLESNGWIVNRTPLSGDQGVDLIVEKNEHRIAVQCKRYNSAVGNTAVQEVYTGMGYYDADEAIVVSNNRYTNSAQELANKLGVKLLHHSELGSLDGEGEHSDLDSFISGLIEGAERGDTELQYFLGTIYSAGYKGIEIDHIKAVGWYERAALQGNADAQYSLASAYAKAEGVDQDYIKAKEWCEKAAEQGHLLAQSYLGFLYEFIDDDNEIDYQQSKLWYEKAAVQGCELAQNGLASLYEFGLGVDIDYAQAKFWYEQACRNGHSDACEAYQRLESLEAEF